MVVSIAAPGRQIEHDALLIADGGIDLGTVGWAMADSSAPRSRILSASTDEVPHIGALADTTGGDGILTTAFSVAFMKV